MHPVSYVQNILLQRDLPCFEPDHASGHRCCHALVRHNHLWSALKLKLQNHPRRQGVAVQGRVGQFQSDGRRASGCDCTTWICMSRPDFQQCDMRESEKPMADRKDTVRDFLICTKVWLSYLSLATNPHRL
jgi:hypothetical protein